MHKRVSRKQKSWPSTEEKKPISLGRHAHGCKVCSHSKRQEIERQFVDWGSPTRMAKDFDLTRDSIYRHAHALGLIARRQRNIRRALERIIEQTEAVEVNASAVVSAVQAYAKINSAGQWINRVEGINMNELFERMNREEQEAYARDGTLPGWFSNIVGATGSDSQQGEMEG